ncbi:hypothetical protein GW17_00034149 [Ensete ventricosum]|nr:hypothetical protein GW17_00034149 [Ensete ventricosum]
MPKPYLGLRKTTPHRASRPGSRKTMSHYEGRLGSREMASHRICRPGTHRMATHEEPHRCPPRSDPPGDDDSTRLGVDHMITHTGDLAHSNQIKSC